jgi:alanine-glyoxylate transaminase/(R)-3-amino-2-methylpropionate-pyruvate transaminase
LAKGIGNGAPLAAVATRREIAQTLAQRLHFNTFGGNPVSMAQGLAVLEVIEEEGLQENARVVGRRFKAGLQKLQSRHPFIGDVRGQGLMLGVELVLDRQTKAPAPAQTARLWEYARQQGVLIGKGGLYANVLRLKPPMCISAEDVDFALEVLDEGLKEIEKEPL